MRFRAPSRPLAARFVQRLFLAAVALAALFAAAYFGTLGVAHAQGVGISADAVAAAALALSTGAIHADGPSDPSPPPVTTQTLAPPQTLADGAAVHAAPYRDGPSWVWGIVAGVLVVLAGTNYGLQRRLRLNGSPRFPSG